LDWETLPTRVEAVIAERIGRVAEPLQSALRVASVEGEVFTAEVVARVQGADPRQVVERLSGELDRRHRLVRAQGILRVDGQRLSQYRFRHTLFQRYLYNSLDEVERVHLHEAVGNTLEVLHEGQAEAAAAIAGQLAWHFQEAGIAAKAIHYLHQAGERAVQLSAYQEAIAHLTRGLAAIAALPDAPTRSEQELTLQLSLGMANMAREGAPSEVRKAYIRARELCQQTGNTSQLSRIQGHLATMDYVQAEHRRARELAEEALSLAEQARDPLLVALNHWRLGFILFAHGDYAASRASFSHVAAFYEPRHHASLVFLSGSDAGLSAMAYDAACLWCLGYPEQALERGQEVLDLARELGHPFTLADVIFMAGCMLNSMRRDAQSFKEHAEAQIRLSDEKGMPTWLPLAICFRAEAMIMLGQIQEGMRQLQEGVAMCRSQDTLVYLPQALCFLAEAQAMAGQTEEGLATLAEALVLVEQTNERHWQVELLRLHGELLRAQGDEVGSEASLTKAIEMARRQQARSWELRATVSLCRLWQDQGKADLARQTLADIYGWFTEGFDTADLSDARALLAELSG
jgi:predicted ATPase